MSSQQTYNDLKKRLHGHRMTQIVELITHKRVADIGTDHGYIPIFAVLGGQADYVLGCDIVPGPLSTAEKNVVTYGLQDHIELRLGNGLAPVTLADNIDTITITGMGGPTIIDILKGNTPVAQAAKQLILSPQSSIPSVRRYVHQLGFAIDRETILRENDRFYHLINCIRGEETYTEAEYQLGKRLLAEKSPVFLDYIAEEIAHLERILQNPVDMNKREQLQGLIALYQTV